MTAVNEVGEFRYRIIDNIPVCFDRIHVGTTIGREDGTFGFGFIEYTPDRQLFLPKRTERDRTCASSHRPLQR